MEINFASHNLNKANFGTRKLFALKLNQTLPDSTTRKVDAFISELVEEDKQDATTFLGKLGRTQWGRQILHAFHTQFGKKSNYDPNKRFFVVECPEFPMGEQAKAIARIDTHPYNIVLNHLNSASDCNPHEKIKGAGSSMLYLASKMAKELDKNSFTLESSSDGFRFYDHMGLKYYNDKGKKCFYLTFYDMDNFISKLENKYSIQEIAKI